MAVSRSLIAPTSNPLLERALLEKLSRRAEAAGSLGKLEPLALRLGLMQNTLKPRLRDPQLLVFAADHGIAVDGIDTAARHPTFEQVRRLLAGQLPLAVFARTKRRPSLIVKGRGCQPRVLARVIRGGVRGIWAMTVAGSSKRGGMPTQGK